MISFIKIELENMEITLNTKLITFCMIYSFFKSDGLIVLYLSWACSRMIFKELLTQFLYKSVRWTEKLYTSKNFEVYYSKYIKERDKKHKSFWSIANILKNSG